MLAKLKARHIGLKRQRLDTSRECKNQKFTLCEGVKMTNNLIGLTGKELRFLSGKLNRREALYLLTGRDPNSMNKIVGAFVHFFRSEANKDDAQTKLQSEGNKQLRCNTMGPCSREPKAEKYQNLMSADRRAAR
jgi:hypothetical protein